MTDNHDLLWRAKLAARLHDPIEKPLVLMRTVEGHEGGTSEALRQRIGLNPLSDAVHVAVKRADHWASAADRAAFPRDDRDGKYPAWQNVRFHEQPVIIHPLTGAEFDLGKLTDIDADSAKSIAFEHLAGLVQDAGLRQTALAWWRFGPEVDDDRIGKLWAMLPADTRVPDHTIFDHLDLVSAFAGAFALDAADGPALLAVSLGPVQDFIAAARTTSDLWAGSHLLSRLAWEAMRVVCDELGPDAILFPRLRGVPQVDLWLRDDCGVDGGLFDDCEWTRVRTDANPLFAAALPNRFTALVPANQARAIAERITTHVREWARAHCQQAFRKVLDAAGVADSADLPCWTQIDAQLAGFPEVHWAAVPWSIVGTDADGKVDASSPTLADAMAPFFHSRPAGQLSSQAWKLVSGGIKLDDGKFWKPNPGTLYATLHELLDRVLGAAKATRTFSANEQTGWRDSLTGEAEWLTTDRAQLDLPPGARRDTVWTRVAERHPAWARRGEHLSALGTLKRLWPVLFMDELGKVLDRDVSRFVVSTHTMAMAGSLARLAEALAADAGARERVAAIVRASDSPPALPRRLARELHNAPGAQLAQRAMAALDRLADSTEPAAARERSSLEGTLTRLLKHTPEAYYGLLLMDGDKMGEWLSASHGDKTLRHRQTYHPQVRAALESRFARQDAFRLYADEHRAPTPGRHMAISDALNSFAMHIAPAIVEQHYRGRILYAGGDDVMAMLPVVDLLPAMAALRAAYSGVEPQAIGATEGDARFERQANGFVLWRNRLLRVMGERATASCGAVIAHHQAPLSAVLRELRAAEQRAKREGGRNAFSLTVVKRSGGALRLTAQWGQAFRAVCDLAELLAKPHMSRRAAYNCADWLRGMQEPKDGGAMLRTMLAYQLARQGATRYASETDPSNVADDKIDQLASALIAAAITHFTRRTPDPAAERRKRAGAAPDLERRRPDSAIDWLINALSVAEFLARDGRGAIATSAGTANDDSAMRASA